MGTEIHWLAIFLSAFAGFAIGGVWYGPLFGKAWMSARGKSEEEIKAGANMGLIFGTTFLLNLWMAFILDHTLTTYGDPDMNLTVMITGGVALGFIIPAMGVNYLFCRHTLKLFGIDAGYWLLNYVAMGVLLDLLS